MTPSADFFYDLSRLMTKPTKWKAKTQHPPSLISLRWALIG